MEQNGSGEAKESGNFKMGNVGLPKVKKERQQEG